MKVGAPPQPERGKPAGGTVDKKGPPELSGSVRQTVLETGRFVKGTVLEIEANGNVIVETSSGRLKASSFTSLEIGKEIWFEVVKGGSAPQLAAALKKNSAIEILQLIAGFRSSSGEQGGAVGTAGSPADEGFLRAWAGNLFGSQADPLKLVEQVARFRRSASGAETQPPSLPRKLDSKLLAQHFDRLDHQKGKKLLRAHTDFNNQVNDTPSGRDLFLFPCFFSEGSGAGEWLFSFGRGAATEGKDSQPYNLSFYLNMSNLGDLHLQLHMRDRSLDGVFSLPSEAAAQHIRAGLPHLIKALSPICDTVNVGCRVSSKGSLQKLKEDLLGRSDPGRYTLLDVTA